jgi:phosphatidate cytidylyltransferase
MSVALKWKNMRPELKSRVKTGAIGGAVLLGLTLGLGTWGTALVAVILALLMTNEYLSMVLSLEDRVEKRQVFLGVVWLVGFFSAIVPRMEYELLLASFLGLFFYFLITASRHSDSPESLERHLRELVYGLFGVLYVGFLPLFLPLIRDQFNGGRWLLAFFLINWVGDSAAYFVGLKKGKTSLYPAISPKKTWEGAWGGLAGGFVVTLLFKLVAFRGMSWAFVIVGPALVGASAQLGDLCESLVKRAFQRKDSGHLLPGHGGVLDRFDGLVVSAPVMYLCIRTLG